MPNDMPAVDLLENPPTLRLKAGVVESLTRNFRVPTAGSDAIVATQSALLHPVIPPPGEQVTIRGTLCVVSGHEVTMVANEPRLADIRVEYLPISVGGDPNDPTTSTISIQAGLHSIETVYDREGLEVFVEHRGDIQPGVIRVDVPRPGISYEKIKPTDKPGALAVQWVGKTNLLEWNGGEPGTWRCEDIAADPIDLTSSPQLWRVRWTFAFNEAGWDPTIAWVDTETNKPGRDLIDGVGVKTIAWHEQLDFLAEFP